MFVTSIQLALEASFRRWCTEKIAQFKEITRKEENIREDIRLIDFGIYLILCKVPSPILEWAVIESACNDGCGDNSRFDKQYITQSNKHIKDT